MLSCSLKIKKYISQVLKSISLKKARRNQRVQRIIEGTFEKNLAQRKKYRGP